MTKFKAGDRVRFIKHWGGFLPQREDLKGMTGVIKYFQDEDETHPRIFPDDPKLRPCNVFTGRYTPDACWGVNIVDLVPAGPREYTVNKLGNFPKKPGVPPEEVEL